jgi:hypothetical protein
MPYTQPLVRQLISRETLHRRVLVAVEIVDPVAQTLVSRNVTVKARGLTGEPILSWGGRFVWLEEQDKWPDAISVTPYGLPFEPQEVVPPRPPDFPAATSEQRRVRIVLRPTPAYDFSDVTAIRGRLVETLDPSSAAVRNARVQLTWRDVTNGAWRPATPPGPVDPFTDAAGQFAVFLRLMKQGQEEPDLQAGMLKVRIQFTSPDLVPETRVTPEDYPFVTDSAHAGRVREGRLLPKDLTVKWPELQPI